MVDEQFQTIDNLQRSAPDSRDHIFVGSGIATLPSVDLIPDVVEVENQGFTNSCTAQAACSALEISYNRAGVVRDFSRLFAYYFIRQASSAPTSKDGGAEPRGIGKALKSRGVCLEDTWPFEKAKINVRPPDHAIEEAKQVQVHEYQKLLPTMDKSVLHQAKEALSLGIPVLVSMALHDTFYSLKGPWRAHSWNLDVAGPVVKHQVLAIGYDDQAQRLLCQNSYGKYWGDGGFFGIPYDFIPEITFEYWILSRIDVPYIPLIPVPKPEDKDIKDFCEFHLYQPEVIAAAAYDYNLTMADLARATEYTLEEVKNYFSQAGIRFWSII